MGLYSGVMLLAALAPPAGQLVLQTLVFGTLCLAGIMVALCRLIGEFWTSGTGFARTWSSSPWTPRGLLRRRSPKRRKLLVLLVAACVLNAAVVTKWHGSRSSSRRLALSCSYTRRHKASRTKITRYKKRMSPSARATTSKRGDRHVG